MKSHTWLHSRNETAAELFVTENLNLHAEEALRFKVIDFIAESPQDLSSKLTSYVLIKYNEGEALRFILVEREEIGNYDVIRSWDFENIDKAKIREFKSTIDFISIPSFLFEFPIVLSMPVAFLFPYIYNIFVVPLLSLTVTPSLEVVLALFSIVNGAGGVACIILLLTKKTETSLETAN